jgi:hypothetical protein
LATIVEPITVRTIVLGLWALFSLAVVSKNVLPFEAAIGSKSLFYLDVLSGSSCWFLVPVKPGFVLVVVAAGFRFMFNLVCFDAYLLFRCIGFRVPSKPAFTLI